MSDELDYLKLQNEFVVLQSKYDALGRQANEYKAERDAAREQLRKYAHATKLIMSAKNMIELACDYLEVYDD